MTPAVKRKRLAPRADAAIETLMGVVSQVVLRKWQAETRPHRKLKRK